jgi:hypothetical protein
MSPPGRSSGGAAVAKNTNHAEAACPEQLSMTPKLSAFLIFAAMTGLTAACQAPSARSGAVDGGQSPPERPTPLEIRGLIGDFRAPVPAARAAGQSFVQNVQRRDENKDVIEKFMKSFNGPLRIRASKPVTVKDATFVLVAQTDWMPAKLHANFPMVGPVEIQLHITNVAKRDVVFPTCGTLGIKVFGAGGKQVQRRSVRDGDSLTRPILLAAGASFSLCPRAEMRWNDKTQAAELVYFDGNGGQSVIGPLETGRYKLVFWFSSPADMPARKKVSDPPMWLGEIVTQELVVEVLGGTCQGICAGREVLLMNRREPRPIRASKPVTTNDARFVAVAEAEWKPAKNDKDVPIEIQLCITNLSKSDIIFPTFDTFVPRIMTADGKRVMPRGSRDGTKFTRPVLIPGGATYSLGPEGGASSFTRRRAALHWDAQTKASELVYFDGTGTAHVFGPLDPGRYKLSFFYRVGSQGPLRTARDSASWIGTVFTDDIVIEVFDR